MCKYHGRELAPGAVRKRKQTQKVQVLVGAMAHRPDVTTQKGTTPAEMGEIRGAVAGREESLFRDSDFAQQRAVSIF
ncbi:unnamed protein product [Sphagnum troendelagicum]|uniref:Uncharacterized protein n=1 Tax=Sphagnum troendelagicum TaxID=128251 RepID=A0ABP0TAV1_9BRYO